jgi:3-methylfumaryl-CoA hydratase
MSDACVIDAATLAHLKTWEGRSEVVHDEITAAPVHSLACTLGADVAAQRGAALPPLWHWLYFLACTPGSELALDGTRRSGLIPSVPLPRRMWAGNRVHWHSPLCIGDAARRESRVRSVTHKRGRSGELVFVQVQHDIHGPSGLAITEEQDIVFRSAAQPGDVPAAPVKAATDAPWQREVMPEAALLFRYSALTFNGHRIHFDRDYTRDVEGYPGLLVHGPLIATLLADLLRRHAPHKRLDHFSFKALRPTFDVNAFRVSGKPAGTDRAVQLWASDHEGHVTMQASAALAS